LKTELRLISLAHRMRDDGPTKVVPGEGGEMRDLGSSSSLFVSPPVAKIAPMPAVFQEAFARVKQLVANFQASGKSQAFSMNHGDGFGRQIDVPVYAVCALRPAEIRIVEGMAK
jgi:hypothetical protein